MQILPLKPYFTKAPSREYLWKTGCGEGDIHTNTTVTSASNGYSNQLIVLTQSIHV